MWLRFICTYFLIQFDKINLFSILIVANKIFIFLDEIGSVDKYGFGTIAGGLYRMFTKLYFQILTGVRQKLETTSR